MPGTKKTQSSHAMHGPPFMYLSFTVKWGTVYKNKCTVNEAEKKKMENERKREEILRGASKKFLEEPQRRTSSCILCVKGNIKMIYLTITNRYTETHCMIINCNVLHKMLMWLYVIHFHLKIYR